MNLEKIKAFSEGFGWVSPAGEVYPIDDREYSTHEEYAIANQGLLGISDDKNILQQAFDNGWLRYIFSGYNAYFFEYSENNSNLENQLIRLIDRFGLKSENSVWANNKEFDNLNDYLEYVYKEGKVFSNETSLQDFIDKKNITFVYDVRTKTLRSLPVSGEISPPMERAIAEIKSDAIFISGTLIDSMDFMEWYLKEYGEEQLPYRESNNIVYTKNFQPTGFYKITLKDRAYFVDAGSVFYGFIAKNEDGDIFFVHDGQRYYIYSNEY